MKSVARYEQFYVRIPSSTRMVGFDSWSGNAGSTRLPTFEKMDAKASPLIKFTVADLQ